MAKINLDEITNEELVRMIQSGNEQEKEQANANLYKKNINLLKKYAAKYYKSTGLTEIEDLIQVGYLGMQTAAERFDESKKTHFVTYAYYYIRKNILAEINKEQTDKIPYMIGKKINEVRALCPENSSIAELSYDDDFIIRIAVETGYTIATVKKYINPHTGVTGFPKSLDEPTVKDAKETIGDNVPDDHISVEAAIMNTEF